MLTKTFIVYVCLCLCLCLFFFPVRDIKNQSLLLYINNPLFFKKKTMYKTTSMLKFIRLFIQKKITYRKKKFEVHQ